MQSFHFYLIPAQLSQEHQVIFKHTHAKQTDKEETSANTNKYSEQKREREKLTAEELQETCHVPAQSSSL